MCRKIVCVSLALALPAGLLCFGKQPARQIEAARPPGYATIQVPVVVTDSSGKPVSGLKAQDFVVKRGRTGLQTVGFEEVQSTAPSGSPSPELPTFIVLDMTTIVSPQLGSAKPILLKYLAEALEAGDPVGLLSVTRTGVAVTHNPGTPAPVLAAALEQLDAETRVLKGRFQSGLSRQVGEDEKAGIAAALDRLRKFAEVEQPYARAIDAAFAQLQGLQRLAMGLRSIPGRKKCLFVTRGLPLTLMEGEGRLFFRGDRQHAQENLQLTLEYQKAIEMLNLAKVTVYPLLMDSTGVDIAPMTKTFSRATAARYIPFQTDLSPAAKEAVEDCGVYYMLLCELPPMKGRSVEWSKLEVDVKTPDLKVRYPEGFFVIPPAR